MKTKLENNVAIIIMLLLFIIILCSCSTSHYAQGITPLNKQYRMNCRQNTIITKYVPTHTLNCVKGVQKTVYNK